MSISNIDDDALANIFNNLNECNDRANFCTLNSQTPKFCSDPFYEHKKKCNEQYAARYKEIQQVFSDSIEKFLTDGFMGIVRLKDNDSYFLYPHTGRRGGLIIDITHTTEGEYGPSEYNRQFIGSTEDFKNFMKENMVSPIIDIENIEEQKKDFFYDLP